MAGGRYLRAQGERHIHGLFGVGGIGWGLLFELCGDRTLGRNESRPARLLDSRDYCKLHIVAHNVAVLMGARQNSNFHVLPVGKVGRDARGAELLEEMSLAGMDMSCVEVDSGRPTTLSVCYQYPDGSGGNITTVDSASMAVAPADVDRAEPRLRFDRRAYAAVALPEVPLETRVHLLRRARAWGCYTVASFAAAEMPEVLPSGVMGSVDLLAINEEELGAIAGGVIPAEPAAALASCSDLLRREQPAIEIVATLGARGAWAFDGNWRHCPAVGGEPVNTAGAGDALLAGVISALAAGASGITAAVEFGVLVAGLKITSRHTIHPGLNLDSLLEFARGHGVELRGALAGSVQRGDAT